MKLYDVYSLFPITPVKAKGVTVWDKNGIPYLDCYGGHAVISIGHSHPHYVSRISQQLVDLGFYSNSIDNPLQTELANLLGKISGLEDYRLFLCNSGAEANENALKLASFQRPDSKKIIAFKNGFHGRTSAAVNVTDNAKIQSTLNKQLDVILLDHEQREEVINEIQSGTVCAIIFEVIQGIGGLDVLTEQFLKEISDACLASGTILIADEVQSGYGRSGDFFAFQDSGILPDLITIAKGMGNGFPIGGVLINEKFNSWPGQLGTTFGGNHLACAAGLAVLEVLEEENVIEQIPQKSNKLKDALINISAVNKVKGKGLMLGLEFDFPISKLRASLIHNQHLFTGSSKNPKVLRILPPLTISDDELDVCITKLKDGITHYLKTHTHG